MLLLVLPPRCGGGGARSNAYRLYSRSVARNTDSQRIDTVRITVSNWVAAFPAVAEPAGAAVGAAPFFAAAVHDVAATPESAADGAARVADFECRWPSAGWPAGVPDPDVAGGAAVPDLAFDTSCPELVGTSDRT